MLANILVALAVSASAQNQPFGWPGRPGSAQPVTGTGSSAAPAAPQSPGTSSTSPAPGLPPPQPPTASTAPVSGALPGMQTSTSTPQAVKPRGPEPPANISGLVLMPTAYRGTGRDPDVGMGLDFNAAYYIGRLYGKNNFDWTLSKTNYIDRIGQWLLTADGKMQIQSEGRWRPALAVGAMGMFAFRDSPQPAVGQTAGPTVTANVKTSNQLGGAYVVASKRFHQYFVADLGYTQGDLSSVFGLLSEFLSPNALRLSGQVTPSGDGRTAESDGMLFGGLLIQPSKSRVFAIEIMKPQGMVLDPILINLNMGSLLKLNFQLSYLNFQGGWDLLGMIQFRYTQFPK